MMERISSLKTQSTLTFRELLFSTIRLSVLLDNALGAPVCLQLRGACGAPPVGHRCFHRRSWAAGRKTSWEGCCDVTQLFYTVYVSKSLKITTTVSDQAQF